MAARRKSRPARPRRTSTKPRRIAKPAARRTAPSRPRTATKTVTLAKPRAARPAAGPASPKIPSGIGLVMHHTHYTSQAMDEVRRFYTELLGLSSCEVDPQVNSLMVRTGPSSSLGFMPPMEGPPEQWRPPREPAIYLFVEDVDRAHADLTARGVEFMQPPQDTFHGHRLAILKDPEGRTVCLAHALKR
jgi:predicted enzyme related to lactoylglutathione lyase